MFVLLNMFGIATKIELGYFELYTVTEGGESERFHDGLSCLSLSSDYSEISR